MSALPAGIGLRASPEERIALRFAQAVGRLHRLAGGDAGAAELLAACAARCWSAALLRGHACIALEAGAAAALGASPAVAVGADRDEPGDAALILDGMHLFLARLWQAERGLAGALRALAISDPLAAPHHIEAEIGAVFGQRDVLDAQQQAVQVALTRRLAVISGGPGTGKTTTLARLIAVFSRLLPTGRIAVAAPTGKAATRVSEALRAQLVAAGAGADGALAPSAMTLHRLLGLRGAAARPAFGAARPLPCALVVVDEASMIDLEMAAALVAAIGPETRLVLCGDRDQLASVEAGAVFAALCAAQEAQLRASIVTLERNYRQRDAPAIAAWAQAARTGALAAGEFPADDPAVRVHTLADGGPAEQQAVVASALAGYAPAFDILAAAGEAPDAAQDVLGRLGNYRVLCALRRGPLGAVALNRLIERALRARLGVDALAPWYPGRFVIVTRNTPELDLFNGDTGVCLARDGALAVAFPASAGLRWVPAPQMPECADAFALTVHQAQGSEFDAVTLVAAPAGHALASRELIYTGITRARRALEIFAGAGALADAAGRPTVRSGLLAQRLGAPPALVPPVRA